MPELPTGTVTFLFTDLEGSTRLWEEHPDAMQGALARHDEILRDAVEQHDGHVVKTTGDGAPRRVRRPRTTRSRRPSTRSAALAAEPWTLPDPLRVRMGVHTGEAELRDGDYYGTAVNRAARVVGRGARRPDRRVARDRGARPRRPPGGRRRSSTSASTASATSRGPSGSSRSARRASPTTSRRCARSTRSPATCPRSSTSFVGRDDELAQDRRRAARRRRRHAHRRRRRRQDPPRAPGRGRGAAALPRRRVAVRARGRRATPTRWSQVVAATLGVPSRAGHGRSTRASSSSSRPKQLLLVLDNCEHLLDAAGDLAERSLRDVPERPHARDEPRGPRASTASRSSPLRSLRLPDVPAPTSTRSTRPTRCSSSSSGPRAAQPDFALDAVERRRGRRDLPPPRRHPAGDRARGGARRGDEPGRDRRRCSTSASGCSPAGGAPRSSATRRCGPPSTGRTRCSTSASASCSTGSACSPARFDGAAADRGRQRRRHRALGRARRARRASSPSRWSSPSETADGTTRYQLLETLRQYARERLDETGDGRRLAPPPRRALRGVRRGRGRGAARPRRARRGAPRARRARQPARRGHLGARPRRRRRRRASGSGSSPRSVDEARDAARPRGSARGPSAALDRAERSNAARAPARARRRRRWDLFQRGRRRTGARRSRCVALEDGVPPELPDARTSCAAITRWRSSAISTGASRA